MGLYETLHKIQKKPENTKRKILVVLVLVSFLLLVGFWLITFKNQFRSEQSFIFQSNEELGQKEKIGSQLLGPVASLKEGFNFIFSDLVKITTNFFEEGKESKEEAAPFGDGRPDSSGREVEERPVYRLPSIVEKERLEN